MSFHDDSNPAALYLSLDQGGQSSRALVFDDDGRVVASASRTIRTFCPRAGEVEHDPVEVMESVRDSVREAMLALGDDADRVIGAALATQRSSVVWWRASDGHALTPVLSWQDRRTAPEIDRWSEHAERIRAISGLRLSPYYGATKLRWGWQHADEVRVAARSDDLRGGPLSTYVTEALCAERPFVVDPSNGGRTLLLDAQSLEWSPFLLEQFEIPEELLPRVVPTRAHFGTIEVEGAPSVPLRVVTGDQGAAVFANGELAADTALVNLGTGGFVLRLVEPSISVPSSLLRSVVYHDSTTTHVAIEGTVHGVGAGLHWLAESREVDAIESRLDAWCARVASPPVFVNAVAGLGSPEWRSDVASAFVASDGSRWIEPFGDVAAEVVAWMESVVFAVVRNLRAMPSSLPILERIELTGGVARLDPLCQRLADLTGCSVFRSHETEATARGAAWLLRGGRAWPGSFDTFRPQPSPTLSQRFERWEETLAQAVRGADG